MCFASTNLDQSDGNYFQNSLDMTQSHIYQMPYQYEYLSTKIDPNISKSYRILSCSRNAENIIHITHKSSKSFTKNNRNSSININSDFKDININDNNIDNNTENNNNTSIEIKFNEWIFNIELKDICLLLIPKNLETILFLASNLIPSFSSISENDMNQKSKESNGFTSTTNSNSNFQETSIPGSFPSLTQINRINKRASSQSIQVKGYKKPRQRNSKFTFKCNLKNFLIFIIDDKKEKICFPYFDYPAFMDGLFDKSTFNDLDQFNSFNDDFLNIKSPAEMLKEYHIKIDIGGLSFQINMISNKYYNNSFNNNINKSPKDIRQTDMTIKFSMESICISEWINGIIKYI